MRLCTSQAEGYYLPHNRSASGVDLKLLFIIENTDNSSCCFVCLYKLYLSKCPPNRPPNVFYLQSLKNPTNDCCWFSSVPIGHATLVGTIARCANLQAFQDTRQTIPSKLAATHLYQAGIDEQLMMERTGHCSLEGVRSYK